MALREIVTRDGVVQFDDSSSIELVHRNGVLQFVAAGSPPSPSIQAKIRIGESWVNAVLKVRSGGQWVTASMHHYV